MQINNNVSAYNVWEKGSSGISELRSSMSKLSSDSRITAEADDQLDLSMSDRLRSKSRNAAAQAGKLENRLGALQTADSWLQKIQDIAGGMNEVAVLASDSTQPQHGRSVLQSAFQQMQLEIQSITCGSTAAAKFNGDCLFSGAEGSGEQAFSREALDLTTASTDIIGMYTVPGTGDVPISWGNIISTEALGVGTQADAEGAVAKLEVGIEFLRETRGALGSEMKALSQSLDELRNYEENLRATEGRIRDVDVAKEMAEMSKYLLQQEAGTAVLAQANHLGQDVMQLMGGR